MHNRTKQILIITIIVSVLLRVAAAIALGNQVVNLPGTADQVSYHTLALRVLGGYGFTFGQGWWPATAANAPTAHWSFLYTAYLMLVYSVFGPNPLAARIIQAVLVGILQPWLVYLIGRRLFGQTAGLAAAALMALYAYFIYYAAALMTESFYITSILASFYLAFLLASPQSKDSVIPNEPDALPASRETSIRYRLGLAVALGLTLGAAVLLRQLFFLFIPFLLLWILFAGRKFIIPILVTVAVIVVMILPITAFNYARFGRIVPLNTNSGFAFFWGNHPIYGTHFIPLLPANVYVELIPQNLIHLDEAALDQALLKQGIQFVVDDPVRYILLSISRIPAYFMFWPSNDSGLVSNISRVASFGIMWPFMLYGVLIALFHKPTWLRLRPPAPVVLMLAFTVIYTIIHLLSWALIRYRLPVDAILLVFAGLALVDIFERIPVIRRWMESTYA